VVLSNWDTTNLPHLREMKFFKPVNLPGLASTRGIKLQKCYYFEDVGLILSSSTRLQDVPAADTFTVEDVMIVSAYICVCMSMYIYMYVCIYISIYVCMYVYICMYIYVCMYVYMFS